MMWLNSDTRSAPHLKTQPVDLDDQGDSDLDSSSVSSSVSAVTGEEVLIWVRGEQRWVSGITEETTCGDVVRVLLQDEQARGRPVSSVEKYQITERWRGVEQPLEETARILDIWNTWGTAQKEVKLSLRRSTNHHHKHQAPHRETEEGILGRLHYSQHCHRPPSLARKSRCRSESSESVAAGWKTVHPKRLHQLQIHQSANTNEELLRLVLKQGEVIRRQLRKLRHSEHQIGYLEDKTHRARVKKHGSNYLLETYLKGLSEAVDPEIDNSLTVDKNSDSGVMTEGDSEQSHNNNAKVSKNPKNSLERLSPSSEEFNKDLHEDDTSSTVSEATVREQLELYEKITKINKRLLKEEEALVRLDANLRKYEKEKETTEEVNRALTKLRTDMTKSACEMQHNEIVLEEIMEKLENRRLYLDNLYRDLANEDKEYEMLQTLLFSKAQQASSECERRYRPRPPPLYQTKELLDTLV